MEQESRLNGFFETYKIPIVMGSVGLVLLIGGIFSSGILPKTFVKESNPSNIKAPIQQASLKVDVSGAVVNPGVYTLPINSRVEDAIKAAGGVNDTADPTYISKNLNLAQKVSDGMKIYITPNKGSNSSDTVLSSNTQEQGLININSASQDQLNSLPGVGTVTSQNIIDKRPYSDIQELVIKKVVTRSVFEKIKDKISVY